jgi:sulfite reductase (ferredoxin)
MLSFQTELDNPVVARDIIELERKIRLFKEGKIDEEKFRSLRLARGVYGQRQTGVQMIRIKIPYGSLTPTQLIRIADIADEYGSGTLHATTRQDIQIHYVSLDKTPELWAKLEEENITLREACGNTVRNITASATAGIDPKEPFDVSPYSQAMFEYFLRNPVCQEMGRKFKIAFSAHEKDSAFTFIHDLGFIPKVKYEQGKEKRGFKVLIGGGLGAQPYLAEVAKEFLSEELLIPFTEATLRVFDRYGERTRRHKARLKFLLQEVGLPALLDLIHQEWTALKNKSFHIHAEAFKIPTSLPPHAHESVSQKNIAQDIAYQKWFATNVFEQKQQGFYGVFVKVLLGNFTSEKARQFARIVQEHTTADIRITINQGYLIRFVSPEALPSLYARLQEIGLADAGFDSTADITACPGTDTCNLGISNSTGISRELEKVIREEYPGLIYNQDIKIKISGCPNSCGQHGLASIGFHGSSLKNGTLVLPALQVLLGGGVKGNGVGVIADKVIKIPSKRGLDALRLLLDDYEENALEGEYYADYYARLGEPYFYQKLKPLADLSNLEAEDYLDWDSTQKFEVLKAVGECAGVIIDLVATLLYEAEEKITWAQEAYKATQYADAIYHAYNAFVQTAKAILLSEDIKTNAQITVLREFDNIMMSKIDFPLEGATSFENYVLRVNQFEPNQTFAQNYIQDALSFVKTIHAYHQNLVLVS